MRRCMRRPLRDDSERMVVSDLSEETSQTDEGVDGPTANGTPRGWICVRVACFVPKTTGRPALDSSEGEGTERRVQPESAARSSLAPSAEMPIDPKEARATARHAMASANRVLCCRSTNTLAL
jgi:hypothetical protein